MGLRACPNLSVLDLSKNGIGPEMLSFFTDMPSLRVLYLTVSVTVFDARYSLQVQD